MDNRRPKGSFHAAAYGGEGWQTRTHGHKDEIGVLWAQCGICDEWSRLDAVVLHRPGDEISASRTDPNAVLMLKTHMEAGHGGASGRFDSLKDVALVYAFGLKVVGLASA